MDGLFTFLISALLLAWLVLFLHQEYLDNTSAVSKPRLLTVVQTGRNFMKDLLTYQVTVAAPVDSDVVARQLTVTVDGVSEGVRSFDGSATDLGTVEVLQDSQVVLSLVDVDDAGNSSEPAVVDFVAADTLPPSAPGAFSVTLVGERSNPE